MSKLPANVKFLNTENISGKLCNHFVHQDFDTIIHIYLSTKDSSPVQLIQVKFSTSSKIIVNEYLKFTIKLFTHLYLILLLFQESIENGVSTPLLTYEYSDVQIGPIEERFFELPKEYSHDQCSLHMGGFPYLHIFHYYVKF